MIEYGACSDSVHTKMKLSQVGTQSKRPNQQGADGGRVGTRQGVGEPDNQENHPRGTHAETPAVRYVDFSPQRNTANTVTHSVTPFFSERNASLLMINK